MTKTDLDAIEARANNATEGPWTVDDEGGPLCIRAPQWIPKRERRKRRKPADIYVTNNVAAYNAEFIAHAREDVPALVAEVRRLHKILLNTTDAICEYALLRNTPKDIVENFKKIYTERLEE